MAYRYRDFLGIRRREEEIVTRQKQIGRFLRREFVKW